MKTIITWLKRAAMLSVMVAFAVAGFGANAATSSGLVHRWSFNGSLDDTVGGVAAATNGACSFTEDGKGVTLAGGSKGTSFVTLGACSGILPSGSMTLEIWATQNAVQNWSRIFDFGSDQNNYLIASWTQGTNLGQDRVELYSNYYNLISVDNTMQPYTLNAQWHISLTVSCNADGTSTLRWAKRDAATGALVASGSGVTSRAWTPASLASGSCYLGHSQWPDNDASATYDEVRIWNRVLSDAELDANAAAGPDGLMGDIMPTPAVVVPSTRYVQSGLLAQWDAIDNAIVDGVRVHDDNAATWKDLTGNGHDFPIAEYIGSQLNGWTASSLDAKSCYNIPAAVACTNYVTLEICAKHNAADAIFFNSGDGGNKFAAYYIGRLQFYNYAPYQTIGNQAKTFQAAAVHSPDVSRPVVYTNAVPVASTGSDSWGSLGTNPVTTLGSGSDYYKFGGEYYAIRLYDRALTKDEIAKNAKLDALRYLGDRSVESLDDALKVAGSPIAIGAATPAYGISLGHGAGDTIACSVPATVTVGETRATCTGYTVTANGAAYAQGDTASFTLQHPGVATRVEWHWSAEYKVAATALEGGSVSIAKQWFASGETATITATPDEGQVFVAWLGVVPEAKRRDATLELEVASPVAVTAVFAPADVFTGDVVFYNGETGPGVYAIVAPEQLDLFRASTIAGTTYEGSTFHILADIDLDGRAWSPCGTFSGVLDGHGHAIRNINIANSGNTGLFSILNGATVRNLSLRGGKIVMNSNNCIGGITGRVQGQSCTIEDCTVDLEVVAHSSYDATWTGGIVGVVEAELTLSRCRSLCAVTADDNYGNNRIGGLVGNAKAGLTIEGCYASGSVQGGCFAYGNSYAGGILGYRDGGTVVISNSYWTAENRFNFNADTRTVGYGESGCTIIDTPAILDNFPKNTFNVRTRGNGTGTAAYVNGEFVATPDEGSVFIRWEGLPPEDGDYNETTVWAVFGKTVSSCEEFMAMDRTGFYVQTADIDMSGVANFEGHSNYRHYGYYDGGNHEIRNMSCPNGRGMFGELICAEIKNLRIVNPLVGTNCYGTKGVLAQYAGSSRISNVHVEGGSVLGRDNNPAGGFAGEVNAGLVEDCSSSAAVSSETTWGPGTGGFVGKSDGNATIRRCWATGDVTAKGSCAGGFVGVSYCRLTTECYATGNVAVEDQNAGGFVGYDKYSGRLISDCYALGTVSATNGVAGGFAGYAYQSTFTNCFSVGEVTVGSGNVAGFGVKDYLDNFSGCCWDMDTSGIDTGSAAGDVGMTTAQMQSGVAFDGWDTTVWKFTAGMYPRLRAFIPKYAVTWLDDDGETVLKEEIVDEFDQPACDTPEKAATPKYTYTFAGWDPEVVAVTGEATYTATYDATVNKYTITWKNDDGTTLDSESVEYDATPTYSGATPTKAATPKYTYTFDGWTPEVAEVTGEATYTAKYDATINEYTITWKNDDGTIIDSADVAYDETPTHADPTKASTAQYHYEFAGWNPEVATVTGEAAYTATFKPVLRSYTITWLNEDGTAFDTSTVEYGATPSHAAPTKASTAQYDYTFAGWGDVVAVTGEATYQATFTPVLRSYTVSWVVEGETVASGLVAYGQTPAYGGTTPTKAETAEYTYTFSGWSPAVASVTGPATYTAQFNATKRSYTITWANIDGAGASATSTVEYGTTPTYSGDTPTKTETAEYTYTFSGWSPSVASVTGPATYTSQFNSTKRSYTITWKNDDGTTIDTTTVEYGVIPAHADATKAETVEYTYTFAGWDKALVAVTGEATYTATFNSTKRSYTVAWVVEGATVQSGAVEYGQTPAYDGDTPTKESTAEYSYEFTGWNPAVAAVTGDATYTAQFSQTKRSYTVSWVVEGETVASGAVEYGTTPTYTGATPTKAETDEYTYEFAGWSPAVASVTGNATYTATFNAMPKGEGGTIDVSTLAKGDVIQDGSVLTGTAQNLYLKIADGATITLDGASITSSEYDVGAIHCLGDATIILAPGSENTVRGAVANCCTGNAIYVPTNSTLTIRGSGSLYADSSSSEFRSAAIGAFAYPYNANYVFPCGDIVIEGGTITAKGGVGIGASGNGGYCGDITITGDANVTAIATVNGSAGIGAAGTNGNCGDITISGNASVTATGKYNAPGIGAADHSTCGDIVIATTGTVMATGNYFAPGIGACGVYEECKCGNITIADTITEVVAQGQNDSPGIYTTSPNEFTYGSHLELVTSDGNRCYTLTPVSGDPEGVVDLSALTGNYTAQDGDVLTGATGYAITIAAGATVTLDGVAITHTIGSERAVIDCAGNATIVLAEGSENFVTNTVNECAAIHPAVDATLTIRGSGSLDAYSSGRYGAGIGAASAMSDSNPYPCGNIVIEGGTITTHGGYCGAGIGAASWSSPCGDITITGDAVVTAVNGQYAACIGAASDKSSCGDITISGNASVTALQGSGQYAAGIGAAYDSSCGNIVIDTTGTVDASGSLSAGIGSSSESTGTCGNITISNGTITAAGGSGGSGIGATTSADCGDILISGGTVIANGGEYGAGIGTLGASRSITITGGNVTATGSYDSNGNGGAGIGSLYDKTCGNIAISGGTVTATGGAWSAGIGSGYCGTCSNITISGGTVTANVCTSTRDYETDTVAIGAGCRGTCGDILISGGTVVADATNPQSTSYDYNSAIGATYVGTCGDITITDGITSVTATKGASAAATHIGEGYNYGSVNVGTVTISPRLAQSLSIDGLTLTLTPQDVPETVTVAWVDEDGTTLATDTVAYGTTPAYGGETPTKAADAQFTYTFEGWTPAVGAATSNTTYTATFSSALNEYVISWDTDGNGEVDDTTTVAYGTVPTHADGSKAATAQYTYTFTGWDTTPVAVTGAATYTATFNATVNEYTISWDTDGNGEVDDTTTVAYGTVPTHADGSKAATAQYTYTFTGWDTAPVAVTGPATYTATFSETVNEYEISWVVEGVTVASGAVAYGTRPTYTGATPTKPEDENYTYTFNGWTPAVVDVIGNATYTATFTATPKDPDDPDEPYNGTETINGITWSYTVANGEATITGADPSDCDLVIPASVNDGIPVTVIGNEAFWCSDITSVVIPNSVTNICPDAFNDCSYLTNVVIGSGVVTIGGCVGQRTSIYDDPDEYIYTGAATAFGACSSLMDFTLAEGNPVFEEIGGALYYRNTPSGAKTLALYPSGRSTLYFADGLTVTKIGDGACAWCQNFDALTIPGSVREIGAASFDFTWMTSVDIPNSVTNICDGAFRNSGELLAVEVPGSVKKIGNGAFYHNISLTTLVLDEGIETIGSRAFEVCDRLNGEVVIPEGVTSIGRSAFSGAYEVDALSLPDTLTFIGADAFGFCESIQRLVVPLSVEEIEIAEPGDDYVSGAFAYCSGLTEIYMPRLLKPETEEATQTYLANIFEGVTTNNTDAERLAEILTWYSDYSEIGGGEPEEPVALPDYVTTGGSEKWYVEGNDGVEPGAWRSGGITHYEETWAETTVNGSCIVSFKWKVSSENRYDKLRLTVDGEEDREPISGTTAWDTITLTFRDSGNHTIRWTYVKDSSDSYGEDCGWVKDFTVTPREFATYTVTWKNYDGTVLGTDSVFEDDMPEYTAATPTRPKDDEYTYVFNGWSPDIVAATGNVEYTATYTALPNLPASVTTGGDAEWFVDTDGSWRSGTIMNSQETWIETTVTGPCLVTFSWKASSEGDDYDMLALAVDGEEKDSIGGVMSDWVEYSLPIPESGAHTVRWTYSKDDSAWEGEDCGWVKDFTETPKTFTSYTVTWKNWDDTVLGEDSVVEGFMPQYRGETPARETDEDYYYDFAGWTPDIVAADADAIYTATYNAHQARFEMIMEGTTVTGYKGLVPKRITLADWPVGVTAVADDVFSGSSHVGTYTLESVEIPATVQTIGQRAFYSSYGLTNLVFEAGGTQPLEIGFAAFSFAYALESVALPARLASIGGSGFYQCTKLATVTFLGDFDSVEIAQDAFKGTPYYATLPFKMILMEIDGQQKVVSYQGTLPKVITAADWPAEATAVAGGSLGWNSIVKDITIPATITSVDAQAFFRSEELTNVVFAAAAPGEDPVPLAIEESAFGECYKLRSVTFRDGLSRIAGYAFYGCPLLAEINFPPSGTEGAYIADSAFAGTEYESNLPFMFYVDEMNIITGFRGTCPPKLGGADGYPWPEGVECIGSDAFSGCTTLEHVTLPAGITAVALGAFRDCRNLATVNFAPSFETLLSIGGEAFSGCTSLETVELDGDGLFVDRGAFEGCSSLTTLTLGAGVSKVDEYAFAYTTSLKAFVNNSSAAIDETAFLGSGYYKDMPFSFITKREYGSLMIVGYKGSPTQINAADWPAGVTYVNRRSFTFCTSLRAIEFPAYIEYIDESAFACCTNLASITFPERSELHVGHNAFALCTKLQNVTLRCGMEVENDAFGGCSTLETVIVEEGVRKIGAGAFARTLVRSIVLPEGIHWVYNDSFAGNDGDFTLYIPRNADDGNYGVSSGSVAYEYEPLIFGLETEDGWARYGFVKQATTTDLRVVPYCRVTLDLAGGIGVATSQLGTGETVNDQFAHPVKAGFAFAGWTSARVAEITNDTTWTAIIGSATGIEATLTALWTPNETPEPPEIVVEDQELKDKLDDPVVDEDTGIRTIKPKDDQTTLTQEDADKIEIVSPLDGVTRITDAYVRTCSWQINEIVISLATPKVEPVVVEENKDEEDATGLLEDVDKVDDGKIAAMPEPDVSDPDPEKREEVGALPVKMYPGLYYQASWGDDLNNLTPGAKFRADGVQTHIGVIKQTGSRGFYKISVSER